MSECPFCRKPFIDCECKGRCAHCNQFAGSEGRAALLLSMVMSGKLIKPGKKLSAALADAEEWKQQHENLLAVRQQDITALNARIEQLESQLANAHKADSELADKLEKLLEKATPGPWVNDGPTDDEGEKVITLDVVPCPSGAKGFQVWVATTYDGKSRDASLICELVNNAPAIIAALRKP